MRRHLLVATLLIVACEDDVANARDQWIVVIGTDALIPQLGDRVLVELLDAEGRPACETCRREFGVAPQESAEPTFPLSFGILPDLGVDRVRARLYRTSAAGAEPGVAQTVEATGRLPEVDGVTTVGLALRMSCFGIVGDDGAQTTCDPSTRSLVPVPVMAAAGNADLPKEGTWPPAAAAPCPSAVPGEMVCIPGGVVFLGAEDPLEGLDETASLPERLLRIEPFALDRDELTVGALRGMGLATAGDPIPRDPSSKAPSGLCTYPADAGDASRDPMPVDCVSRTLAEAACNQQGKRLPTEDEWEYAAGSRSNEWVQPWGDDDSENCARAILARGRTVLETDAFYVGLEAYGCRGVDPPGAVAGGNARDVTIDGVRNMAGNVDEWTLDAYALYTDACWTVDLGRARLAPCLVEGQVSPRYAVRGGSYLDAPAAGRVTRRKVSDGRGEPGRGFRCARSF